MKLRLSTMSLVMNFTKPTAEKPALLTLSEVETFLHEFGHSLHGMFANTRFQSLSGTNVWWDFVELPSQFMENYAVEKEFLSTFAYHYQTGEPLPDELIRRIVDSRNFMSLSCGVTIALGQGNGHSAAQGHMHDGAVLPHYGGRICCRLLQLQMG